jgi:beta-glucosidase
MFNEPNIHAIFGHGVGQHAPGLTGMANMLAAIHHQNLAQGRALQALRAERTGLQLGTIVNAQPIRPSSQSLEDRRAAERFDAFWSRSCLDPLMKGSYPAPVAEDFGPLIADGDLATIQQPVDYIGVNYYGPSWVAAIPQSLFGAWFGAVPQGTPLTAMGWPVDPAGLTDMLIDLRDRYDDPQIYVTENGACYDETVTADGAVQDEQRVAFLRDHIAAARRALAAGVKLRGYFVWSLLDNFEWQEGYSRRFGVVHVDFATLKRTPKSSFAYLAGQMQRR